MTEMSDAELSALTVIVLAELHDHEVSYPDEVYNSRYRSLLTEEVERREQNRIKSMSWVERNEYTAYKRKNKQELEK